MTFSAPVINERSAHMPKPDDLSRSFMAFEQDSTLIAIIEMSLTSWLVAGIVPEIERHPLKKLDVDEEALLQLLHRWRDEAINAGRKITRMVLAFEAGRDGFWLARWLRARNIEAYVIHPNSVAVSREHRRAKTDRLDTELLKRAFLGWLRGESDHCGMAAIPTLREEDARRPNRERENLLGEKTRIVNRVKASLIRFGVRNFKPKLRKAPERLEALRTPEGGPRRRTVWPSCAATWRAYASSWTRSERLKKPAYKGWNITLKKDRTRWFGCWPASSASALRRQTCSCTRYCLATCGIKERSLATPVSPALQTRAARGDGKKVSLGLAMPASGEA
jgi:hypothetical protein